MKRASAIGRGDLGASLVLVFPLWLFYAVGVLVTNHVNGVDFVSRHVWAACSGDHVRYLVVHATLAVAFVLWLQRSGRARTLTFEVAAPVILEAAIYAVTLASAIHLVMRALPMSISPLADNAVASAGAGVHEELVFRLGLCGGGAWLLLRAGLAPRLAVGIAILVSSALFSWAHHIGPHGDPWSRDLFTFRLLAGVAFALIWYFRSLAHAVYAHALYDIWILQVSSA
jgi:hypothetical protein